MHSVNANGADIPALGFGTWTLGGARCEQLVARALAVGYRHIDTAIMYGNEAEVGRAIAGSGVPRDDVFLTTKVWYTDIGAGQLERAAEASLAAPRRRPGRSSPDPLAQSGRFRLPNSIGALNRARERGLTRHIGVSNFTIALLEEACALSDAPLVCNQVESHPFLDQRRVHAACRAHGMAMTAYAPLGRGGDLLVAGADPRRGRKIRQDAGPDRAQVACAAGGGGLHSAHLPPRAGRRECADLRLRAVGKTTWRRSARCAAPTAAFATCLLPAMGCAVSGAAQLPCGHRLNFTFWKDLRAQ